MLKKDQPAESQENKKANNRDAEIAKVFQEKPIQTIEKPAKRSRFMFVIIVVALLVGIAGGVLGELALNYWMLTGAVNLPWFNKLRLEQYLPTKELVVTKRESVTVAQDAILPEMTKKIDEGQVVFFRKIAADVKINRLYSDAQRAAQGVVLTNDGWISAPLSGFDGKSLEYFGVDSRGETFAVKNIIRDPFAGIVYLETEVKFSRPLAFLGSEKVTDGMLVVARDAFGRQSFLSSVVGTAANPLFPVEVSDKLSRFITVQHVFPKEAMGSAAANFSGEVAGMVVGANTIVPSDMISAGLKKAISDKKISRPFFGITGISTSMYLEKPFAERKGIVVGSLDPKGTGVAARSPAAKAGLRDADILLAINGEELTSAMGLGELLMDYQAGDTVEVKYTRKGNERTANVKLEAMP